MGILEPPCTDMARSLCLEAERLTSLLGADVLGVAGVEGNMGAVEPAVEGAMDPLDGDIMVESGRGFGYGLESLDENETRFSHDWLCEWGNDDDSGEASPLFRAGFSMPAGIL